MFLSISSSSQALIEQQTARGKYLSVIRTKLFFMLFLNGNLFAEAISTYKQQRSFLGHCVRLVLMIPKIAIVKHMQRNLRHNGVDTLLLTCYKFRH